MLYFNTATRSSLLDNLRLCLGAVLLTTLFGCQTGSLAPSGELVNPANLNSDVCNSLVDTKVSNVSKYLQFPILSEQTHSMAYALPKYVCQKIPCAEIEEIVGNGGTVKIIGAPPEVLKVCKSRLNLPEFDKNEITKQKAGKRENIYRPVFFTTKAGVKDMYVSVMAGEDYIRQVSAMVSYAVQTKTNKDFDKVVSIATFPKLESSIAAWTGLSEFVNTNDTVLIGNVVNFHDFVRENGLNEVIAEKENFFYKSTRIRLNSRVLNFLIVKHTFWAGMSAKLVHEILQKNVYELIYMSKVATLSSPKDIYNKVYSPGRYLQLRNGQFQSIKGVKNKFAEYFPKLETGTHLSVSTVMEEDLKMTELARSMDVKSLDLEISGMAEEVRKSNRDSRHETRFSSVHIVTDYLRGPGEIEKDTVHDLSNSRSLEASTLKKKSWVQIYKLMLEYLTASSSGTGNQTK